MTAKNYRQVEKHLLKAIRPLGDPEDKVEALVVYLIGCSVSVLQEPTEERLQDTYRLLSQLVEKNRKEDA